MLVKVVSVIVVVGMSLLMAYVIVRGATLDFQNRPRKKRNLVR